MRLKHVKQGHTYRSFDEGRKAPILVGEGGVVEVSDEKGKQLLKDFPSIFKEAGKDEALAQGKVQLPAPTPAAGHKKAVAPTDALKKSNTDLSRKVLELEGELAQARKAADDSAKKAEDLELQVAELEEKLSAAKKK